MTEHISVASPRESITPGYAPIDTTSKSKNWSRNLSPFFVGPCRMYENFVSKNVENAWQFSKVYKNFLNHEGEILPEYWEWAKNGWKDSYAHRYPAGKGAVPAFSYWNGERLQYVESRIKIYLPLYAQAVVKTEAFEKLSKLSKEMPITLIDFDVYKAGTKDLYKTLIDPRKKFGHGFVLYGLLTGEISYKGEFIGTKKREPQMLFQLNVEKMNNNER